MHIPDQYQAPETAALIEPERHRKRPITLRAELGFSKFIWGEFEPPPHQHPILFFGLVLMNAKIIKTSSVSPAFWVML